MLADRDNECVEILDMVYCELFKRLQQKIVDVFLCGGVSTKEQISMRDKLKKELEKSKAIRVLYPEELFMDILNLNKKQNLLRMEQILAENCDKICIVCESVGSFVELGAFTNNEGTFAKVIALVQTKYKNQESFLMLGPIKHIRSFNDENVIFYNRDIFDATKKLVSRLQISKSNNEKDLNSIVGLHYFILLALYFFKEVEMTKMIEFIKALLTKNKYKIDAQEFSFLFRAALKLLYRDRLIERYINESSKYYRITQKGQSECKHLLSTFYLFDKLRICDKIRMRVLYSTYY